MSPEIALFFEKASAAGIPHESVAKVLIVRGWPEKEVYEALAQLWQAVTVLRRICAVSKVQMV